MSENAALHCTRLVAFSAILLIGHSALGQEPALPPCVASQTVAKAQPKAASDAPQFYDEPQFTVAGVQDASQTGGHGSDVVRRTTETLTKETVALGAVAAGQTTGQGNDQTALRAAVAHEPGNAGLHHALGGADEKKGDSLAAAREYQRAAELDPNETNLFDWGTELLLHRAYEPAGEVFTKGRRLFPASVRMAVGLGVAAYALGSYDTAAQRLCEASDLSPSDPKPYLFLGKLQTVDSGPVPGVVERLARFSQVQPNNAWASYYYALALWRRREVLPKAPDQAEALLKKAVELDPKLAVGYLQLGVIYAAEKAWPKAVEALERAVKADPDLEEGHFRLATAYRRNGEPDRAKVELEIYQRIANKNNGEAERNRHEIVQFVYSSRSGETGPAR